MAVGDVYEVKIVTRITPPAGFQANGLNIRHWVVEQAGGTGATATQRADAISNHLFDEYRDILPTTALYQGVRVQKISPLPVEPHQDSIFGAGLGARIGELLPFATCGMITLRSQLVGRRNRGRMFIPWPLEGDNDPAGHPVPAYQALLNALALKVLVKIIAGVAPNDELLSPVIFHRGPPPPPITPITNFITRNYWVTQRRRNNAFRVDTPLELG